jgi:glucoamylase
MSLIWAPAEFIKLSISRQLGYPIDRPRTVWRRYRGAADRSACLLVAARAPIDSMLAGQRSRSLCPARPSCTGTGRLA